MKTIFTVIVTFGLLGCATPSTNYEQALYEAMTGYDGALKLANAYANLPRCNVVSKGIPCSSLSKVVQINTVAKATKAQLDVAFKAVSDPAATKAAQAAAVTAAQTQVNSLTTQTSNLGV